ncbi:DUF1622 domain-containing protein [Sphingomonas sp. ST-64]|uniref:DUF1622 domain-containing protein n=1 Tax=Sphingomonas plantiphila TaxID=3163295 RepID=A0ABW8YMY1_9SPHN
MIDDAGVLQLVHLITRWVELAGIAVILIGALWSAYRFVRDVTGTGGGSAYRALRSNLGRSILLGLELLVAADIINTVAVEPTLTSVAVLAGIVAIRTLLSLSLELEIEGRWPWQRGDG